MNFPNQFATLILSLGIFFSCSPNPEKQARELLEKSMSVHGGSDNWEKVEVLRFKKSTRMLNEDGTVENETEQLMEFRLKPFFEGKVTWVRDSVEHISSFDGVEARYSMDGNDIRNPDFLKAKKKELEEEFDLVAQPWQLLQDERVKLIYEGLKENSIGKSEIIRVDYGPDQDVWWFYFDPETFRLTGNEVQMKDYRILIENLNYREVGPFLFYGERKSYWVNEKRGKLYLRAEYRYTDFEIK